MQSSWKSALLRVLRASEGSIVRRELEGTQEALEEAGKASIHHPRCEKGCTCLEQAVTCIPGGRRDSMGHALW